MILYKYLRPRRVDVLENKRIAFPRLCDQNDPYEGQLALLPDANEMDEALKDNYRVEQVAYKVHFENRYSQFGVLCLCEEDNNVLMWTHYADNHKGFVIGFDTINPFFNTSEWELDKPYPDELIVGKKGFGSVQRMNYQRQKKKIQNGEDYSLYDIFFAKSHHWEYEQEYRIVKNISKPSEGTDIKMNKQFPLIQFPVDAVKEIILGLQTDEETTKRLLQLKRDFPNSIIRKAYLNYLNYQIDIKDDLAELRK